MAGEYIYNLQRLTKQYNKVNVLDDVNEELAKVYYMEYLNDFLDQEPTP